LEGAGLLHLFHRELTVASQGERSIGVYNSKTTQDRDTKNPGKDHIIDEGLNNETNGTLLNRILLIEDESDLRAELAEYLQRHGFVVTSYADGRTLRNSGGKLPFDLILLDLMIPGDDGITLTREVRARSNVPIIIITGRNDVVDRVVGLEIGADDYISKPFDFRELQARIKAVIRRHAIARVSGIRASNRVWDFLGWQADGRSRTLMRPDGEFVDLTTAEYMLLEAFLIRPGQLLSRDLLLEYVYNRRWSPLDRSIDNLVARLRKKLEDRHKGPIMIKTVRSRGYLFTPEVVETKVKETS
jgi:two-component system OmpR family response regulator